MKKIILFCAVFFLSFSLLNAQTTEVEKWTIRGDEYYDAKDYQNAKVFKLQQNYRCTNQNNWYARWDYEFAKWKCKIKE